jgi:rhomboid protease GluP
MRNPSREDFESLTRVQAERVYLLLTALDIEALIVGSGGRRYRVEVAPQDLDRALALLRDEFPEGIPEFRDRPRRRRVTARDYRWFGRGSAAVLFLLAVCVAVHVAVHRGFGPSTSSRMIDAGAIAAYLVDRGQWWRLFTAVFLHFDTGHLLSNMATLSVVGPPLARLVGGWRLLLVFVATGVLANIGSHVLHPIGGLKAGASGGVAGILGALAGQSMRPDRDRTLRPWIAVGALGAFYAMMIGFGPGRDNYAHVGGVLTGFLLGRLLAPLPEPEPLVTEDNEEAAPKGAGPGSLAALGVAEEPDLDPSGRTLH